MGYQFSWQQRVNSFLLNVFANGMVGLGQERQEPWGQHEVGTKAAGSDTGFRQEDLTSSSHPPVHCYVAPSPLPDLALPCAKYI